MNIEICTLTRDIADDYIDYFGNSAFLMVLLQERKLGSRHKEDLGEKYDKGNK